MVKFLVSIFLLFATFSSLAFASPLQPDGINKFIGDLNHLSGGISRLATAVNSIGNKLTIGEALALRTAAEQVQVEFNQANSEAKSVHRITTKEARSVLGITAGFAPVLVEALGRFSGKRHAIEKLHVIPIREIEEALKALHNSASKLTTVIVDLEPSGNPQREARDIKSEINAAFLRAIKVYS